MESKINTHEEILINQTKINQKLLQSILSINKQLSIIHISEQDMVDSICDIITDKLSKFYHDIHSIEVELERQSNEIERLSRRLSQWSEWPLYTIIFCVFMCWIFLY